MTTHYDRRKAEGQVGREQLSLTEHRVDAALTEHAAREPHPTPGQTGKAADAAARSRARLPAQGAVVTAGRTWRGG